MKTFSSDVFGRLPRPLPRGHLTHEGVVDVLDDDAGVPRLQHPLIALDESAGQALLGGPDGPPGLVVDLDGDVGHAAGGQVGGHVHLASSDDAAVDDGCASGGGEATVGRCQTDLLQRPHQLTDRLGLVDPAQELPDRREVLDVVDQRCAGQGHEQRVGGPRADALGELQDVLGPLRLPVLDVVRLVDHHRAQTQLSEPAHMPVEHLVVDDDDVREAVDRVAVAVDHRRGVARRPQHGLARPVHLHHVRHDDEQRVGVRRLRGQQRLCRLAQAGLVGEQERPVPRRRGGDQPALVRHEFQPAGHPGGGRLRQVHARQCAAVLEGLQQRLDELPAEEAAGLGAALGDGGEVGFEEGVGQLARDHRLGHHPAWHGRRGLGRLGLSGGLFRHLDAGRLEELAAQGPGAVGDDGVVGQQPQQGGVAGCRGREDGGDAVEAFQLLGAPSPGLGLVCLDAGAFLAHEECHHLELGPDRGQRATTLDRGLDLADDLGEHLDDAVVVVAGSPLGARACAVVTLGSSSHGLLLGAIGHSSATGLSPHRTRGGQGRPSGPGWRRPGGANWSSGSARDRRVGHVQAAMAPPAYRVPGTGGLSDHPRRRWGLLLFQTGGF